MGGRPTDEPLTIQEHALADWEVIADAVAVALGARGIRTTDESRRAMEDMPADEGTRLVWWALRILRQNGVIPDEVRLHKSLERLRERIDRLVDRGDHVGDRDQVGATGQTVASSRTTTGAVEEGQVPGRSGGDFRELEPGQRRPGQRPAA